MHFKRKPPIIEREVSGNGSAAKTETVNVTSTPLKYKLNTSKIPKVVYVYKEGAPSSSYMTINLAESYFDYNPEYVNLTYPNPVSLKHVYYVDPNNDNSLYTEYNISDVVNNMESICVFDSQTDGNINLIPPPDEGDGELVTRTLPDAEAF
jgi:hypothetical protein